MFKAEPDDRQTDFEELRQDRQEFKAKTNIMLFDEYGKEKHKVKGHYVEYPTQFMINQNLDLQASNVVTKLVPAINFV